MKFTATKPSAADKPATRAAPQNVSLTDDPGRYDLIAKGAYYKAEERGFTPGHALDDWLSSETEVSTKGERS